MAISNVAQCSTGSFVGPLYDAAMTGSVDTLDRLLEVYGRAVLCRISLTSFAETPLHLAPLLGHLEFTKRLLELRPELATEQDSERCTPLHLAAANGHDHVVRELLRAEEKACLLPDQDGRVPLHLAAMRGRVPVVRELLSSTQGQKSLKKKVVHNGDGILHLCVKYNCLDVLKAVLASTRNDDGELLKMTDSHGNTVLHLAVMLKQSETVRFLLELPRVKAEVVNATNAVELTALDILNHSPMDYKSLEIRELLTIGAGTGAVCLAARRANWARLDGVGAAVDAPAKEAQSDQVQKCWSLWEWACPLVNRLMEYRGDWMNDTKGSLMTVSTIIATVTFSTGMAPPGGYWQQDTTTPAACRNSLDGACLAGLSVVANYFPEEYITFMKYDMISFFSSLAVVFLLISGLPLKNKFCLWLLSLFMCLTVSFLGLTFVAGLWLIVPRGGPMDEYHKFKSISHTVWEVMMCVVGLTLLIRLSSWLRYNSTLLKAGRKRFLGRGSCNPCAQPC